MNWAVYINSLLAWFYIGTEGQTGQSLRRLVITNVLITLEAFLFLFYAVLFALYDPIGLVVPISIVIPGALLLLLTPYLHKYNPYAGSAYNLVVWMVIGMSNAYLFGAAAGLHFYFLAGSTVAILILGIRHNLMSICSILINLICFILVDRTFDSPAPFIDVSSGFLSALYYTSISATFVFILCIIHYALFETSRAEAALQREHEYSERLLANMMPAAIASKLKAHPGETIAQGYDSVSILFADIVGFSKRAREHSPQELVKFLNVVFTCFDELAIKHGLEKIKTIGDAFMAAAGLPENQPDHAVRVARLALEIQSHIREYVEQTSDPVEIRIGIHTGPVVAGVIGTRKLFYDVWGDTVNTAAHMESAGTGGKIQVTEATKNLLEHQFIFTKRGSVDVKGVGPMEVWILDSEITQDTSLAAE